MFRYFDMTLPYIEEHRINLAKSNYNILAMWMCRLLIKVITGLADGLYNIHFISFVVSVGSIRESLQLIELLDEEE